MTRPAPRKSNLAGSSPVTSTTDQQPAVGEQPPATDTRRSAADDPQQPADQSQANSGQKRWRNKVSFYQDRDEANQVRAAVLCTQAQEGPRSMSEFIQRAVMAEVRRLQNEYNNGEPFPPVSDFPRGATVKAR